ncbi:chromosomal replication initiator protein DnaA [Candidatus Trichorickettsia mobilis]|uniref:chromosomal replication initiator protein DnaA n=1 Tax=Candidatus Trichorickettsia mobilis TaxID=1346319 RepID=UPI00292D755C|nr:chromosomal replication initiator protein DnaA [Candidatus Trichorickettsia mobilis]
MLNNGVAVIGHNKHQEIWCSVSRDLRDYYGEAIHRSWFSKIYLMECTTHNVVLSTPTNFIRDWVKSHYLTVILQFWQHYDQNIKVIELITKVLSVQEQELLSSNVNEQIVVENSNKQILGSDNSFANLDPRFTFENFVVGPPNELAYAAARAVAESRNVVVESNPLFLYGGVGLGKTHLMHAIAWYIRHHNPLRKVIYMSAEKFMYQFVKALRNKDVMSFKEEFRSVDVLMIDDIQFICGKDSTQEEFFHTFNALIDNNRQMVISCDRSPSDLDDIEDRIKSRLGWGLVADVHSTTYELRLGILESKLEQMNIHIPQDVIEFLAAKITSNVRELEGALNKVIAHSTLVSREVNLSNTQDILRDLLRSNERIITIEDIQRKIAERYNIKVADMSSTRRVRSVARPRQLAMYLSKILTPKSLADIGKKFGKKDHTTVMHAIKRIEELCALDVEFREEVSTLTRILQS